MDDMDDTGDAGETDDTDDTDDTGDKGDTGDAFNVGVVSFQKQVSEEVHCNNLGAGCAMWDYDVSSV